MNASYLRVLILMSQELKHLFTFADVIFYWSQELKHLFIFTNVVFYWIHVCHNFEKYIVICNVHTMIVMIFIDPITSYCSSHVASQMFNIVRVNFCQ